MHENGSPSICEYLTPTVNPEEFLSGLGSIIRENQTGTGPCVGCRYLKQTQMPRKFVSSFISYMSLHDFCGCNSQCVYCTGSEYHLPKKYVASLDHEMLFNNLLTAKLVRPQLTSVGWGGGEPTLLNTFEKVVDLLRINRMRQTINTSGIRFSNAIERALKARLATVQISVDSGTNDTYSKVKRNQHCDNVWESIRRYASTGGDLIVKYIVFSMNSDAEEIDCFVRRSENVGVRKISISVDARSVYTQNYGVERITLKELVAASLLRNLARTRDIESHLGGIWLPEHIEKINEISNFPGTPSLLSRALWKLKSYMKQE